MNRRAGAISACVLALTLAAPAAADAPTRIRVTGEIIDSWCQVSKIMGTGIGTAHHQCAIWCAVESPRVRIPAPFAAG